MEKHTWDNGLRVLLLPEKEAMSASVDIWVEAGSRYESPAEQGISHFTEHMLFKGTGRRTARQISEEIDGLGGTLNAYTTRAYTRYYAQALAADPHPSGPAQVLDILLDMLLHSRLDPEELELERGVILEEIAMYEDIGEDLAHEALCGAVWPQSPLGRPVCGYPETVGGITASTLRRYVSQTYTPERMLVVLAGHFDADGLLLRLEESLGRRPRGRRDGRRADTPGFCPGITLRAKPFEQVSFEIGFPGLAYDDERRYAMMLLNFIVGGRRLVPGCSNGSGRRGAWSIRFIRPMRRRQEPGCLLYPPRLPPPTSGRRCGKSVGFSTICAAAAGSHLRSWKGPERRSKPRSYWEWKPSLPRAFYAGQTPAFRRAGDSGEGNAGSA